MECFPLMKDLVKELKQMGGDTALAVTHHTDNGQELYLLYVSKTLVASLVLQTFNSKTYINVLDTTGYHRGYTRRFVSAILRQYVFVICFSRPRPEYIFNFSSRNANKKVLESVALLSFWKDCLHSECREIYVWGNNVQQNFKHPYRCICEIERFDDDPKARLLEHLECETLAGIRANSEDEVSNLECSRHKKQGSSSTSVKPERAPSTKHGLIDLTSFFNGLLCRSDFVDGCLIYAVCTCSSHTKLKGRHGAIEAMIAYLRKLDFSSIEASVLSTQKFLDKFDIILEYFQTEASPMKKGKAVEEVVMLDVRKKPKHKVRNDKNMKK